MRGCKMSKVIDQMNFNYYNTGSSNLALILLGIEKASINNGTYSQMQALFDREILSSKCFSDDKHADMDNLLIFNANLKNAYMRSEEMISEETIIDSEHSRIR